MSQKSSLYQSVCSGDLSFDNSFFSGMDTSDLHFFYLKAVSPTQVWASWWVWARISLGGPTDLHVFHGGTVIDLMDDNARPHRAVVVEESLEGLGLERMEWSARSPDLIFGTILVDRLLL
ncbi:transposable element Tcb2 transposase [Caerostris extrusa]|uniref:Transposable element Tcb2 transposase n=1 Tax=Caerostris extrusa TaxID=172846 RepID=A0AAV4UDF6_CAEEX|nr:transposable element Tcb2 transposase [Caerostris extrusa]